MAQLKRLARALTHWTKLRRLFDAEFYLRKYPDIAAAEIDPFRHYLEYGSSEGRKPRALFDTDYYLLRCPEARKSGEGAAMHFLRCTGENCASPHPLFDCAAYLRAHPDAARENPLLHYLRTRTRPRPAAALVIMDVEVAIAFTESAVDGAVSVWEDAQGRLRFIAPPEQHPFFEAMKYDQLRAQL